jgi:hypothetical protein
MDWGMLTELPPGWKFVRAIRTAAGYEEVHPDGAPLLEHRGRFFSELDVPVTWPLMQARTLPRGTHVTFFYNEQFDFHAANQDSFESMQHRVQDANAADDADDEDQN